MGDRLAFRVLGAVSATVDGQPVPTGGARQRTVLALLLVNPGRTVPVDALVEAVWNGSPPATARTQIAIVVARLRKALKAAGVEEDVVVTASPGYVLRLDDPLCVDAAAFAALVEEAGAAAGQRRYERAAARYAEAFALWTGPAFDGVVARAAEDEAARLEERRRGAHDEFTAVRLALGEHQSLVPELAALVREEPLRERPRRHLMLALYRSGRRAEALASYREGRERSVAELGVEPGPALRSLHEELLREEPTELPRSGLYPSPRELPPDPPGFVGRDDELDRLDALFAQDGPALGLVTGTAGVGKTGLAVRWAHRAAAHFPDGLLFADLRGYDEEPEPVRATDVIGRFLRALGVRPEQLPPEEEELVALYRSVLAGRRVLLVLDNVRGHERLAPLLPGGGGSAVLVTSREPLPELVAWPPRARVHLGVLPPAEAVGLLAVIAGEDRVAGAPEDAARLAELCDRLPLALRVAAARLASKPHWTVGHLVRRLADEHRRLDELSRDGARVRAGFEVSYRCLSREAARLYRGLGLLDVPDFTAWVAGALLGVGAPEGERLVEDLVDARFLDVVGADATGRLRYRLPNLLRLHAREQARAEESAEEQRAMLEQVFGVYVLLAEEAYRREYGSDGEVVRHAATPSRAVPAASSRGLDTETREALLAVPLQWLEAERLALVAVVVQAAGLGLAEAAWRITAAASVLFDTRNYPDDCQVCARAALAACEETGDRRGLAAMLHELGAVEQAHRRLDAAHAYYARALELCEELGEDRGRARNLRNLAMIERFRGDLGSAVRRLDSARELGHAAADRQGEALALGGLAQIALERGEDAHALALAEEAVRLGAGNARGLAQALHRLGQAHLACGAYGVAEEVFARVVELVWAKEDRVGLVYASLGLGESLLGAHEVERAAQTLSDALVEVAHIRDPLVDGRVHLALAEARHRQGRLAEARDQLVAAQAAFALTGARGWLARTEAVRARLEAEGGVGRVPGP
ncbi:BTAD domain-containing putative transcriptional regulator [Streptomyces sp. NPDC088923]|uniref:AfsR/SARP family transcriptional regulator n=1 Tax=Streptomyces sp. NPDC088923 TaxID=3365913 RepID=UPI0037FF3650